MSYYADLTPCDNYFCEPEDAPLAPVLAVGWLDGTKPFTTGDPGIEVYRRLQEFRQAGWDYTCFLGSHDCELCRYDQTSGTTNLWVPGDGVVYCAPELILHYIAAHGYLPPKVFREAVLQCPPYGTSEHLEALRAYGFSVDDVSTPTPQELADRVVCDAETAFLDAALKAWQAIEAVRGAHAGKKKTADRLIAKRLPWTRAPLRNGGWRMQMRRSVGKVTVEVGPSLGQVFSIAWTPRDQGTKRRGKGSASR